MPKKSLHYWQIHARVCKHIWRNLDVRTRDIIAADADHQTHEFKSFVRGVNMEAERLYNDPEFFMNDPFSFKHPQLELAA